MKTADLDSLLEYSIDKLSKGFPELKKIGAFDLKNYYFEDLPANIFGSYNSDRGKICINSSVKGRIGEYRKELFDTIIHEEAHLIERKLKKEPSVEYASLHSIYWFGIYKKLGGNLNGFYVKNDNGRDTFIDFSILNYHLNMLYELENNYDSKINALAKDFKKPLLELISNATIIDLSGFDGQKDKFVNQIYSSENKNPILIFEQENGFSIIKNGRKQKIKINYDFGGLRSWIEYL